MNPKLENFIKLKFVLLLFCLVFLSSCKEDETQIAQSNIELFFENLLSKKLSNKFQIQEFKHSKMYILEPLDKSKVVKPTIPDENNEEEVVISALSMFDTFVGLGFSGCTRRCLNTIIQNDNNYREWQTGAKEYVVITFVNVLDESGKHSKELGLCFKLSKDLNILDTYSIPEEDEDYIYIKLFGQTSKRFYGAVDCEYNYLTHMYDNYVEKLNDADIEKLDDKVVWKYVYVKKLNKLFGTEYFEILDNREKTIENCLNKLDSYYDKKVLKDKAYNNIKSL